MRERFTSLDLGWVLDVLTDGATEIVEEWLV
jgi:hypothetical protein